MAFCVSEDQDRQRQVFEQIGPHTPAYAIRRAVTEAKVRVDDRRVRFVGVEAYAEAGGEVLRDLEKACAKSGVRTRHRSRCGRSSSRHHRPRRLSGGEMMRRNEGEGAGLELLYRSLEV